MSPASLPPDEVLERLSREIEQLLAAGRAVDPAALGARLGVAPSLVADCVAGITALQDRGVAHPPSGLGRYQVRGELSRGGMGVVYRAFDPALDREVALKVLAAGEHARPQQLERFRREATALASLRHPHVVAVHEVGVDQGRAFLAMELIEEARTLDRVAPELGWEGRVALVRDAARGLGHAHRQGIVHRDVKPANLLVGEDGRLRVTDFGLARDESDATQLTRSGALVGTVGYMAPEQAGGSRGAQGPATDVWGLGVVLYELLGGRLPFPGDSASEFLQALLERRPPPPLRGAPRGCPRSLEAVCARALEYEPGRRYPHGDALADDLDRVLAGKAPEAYGPRGGRRRAAWPLAAGGALGAVALALLLRRDPQPAPPGGESAALLSSAALPRAEAPIGSASARYVVERPRERWPGPVEADPAARLQAAWRWLVAHPGEADALDAREYLAEHADRQVLTRLSHGERDVRVGFADATTALTFGRGGLQRWDLLTGRSTPLLAKSFVRAAVPAPGGWLVQRSKNLELLATLESGAPSWSTAVPLATRIALSPSGRTAACVTRAEVQLIDVASGARRVTLPGTQRATHLAFLDEDRLVLLSRAEEQVQLWDAAAGRSLQATVYRDATALALSPDRRVLILAVLVRTPPAGGQLLRLDPETLQVEGAGPPGGVGRELRGFAFTANPVGELLFAPGGEAVVCVPDEKRSGPGRALERCELATGAVRRVSAPLREAPSSAALSPDGALCAVGFSDGAGEVWWVGR